MYRTIGYVFVVLLIGTVAIAWSHQETQKTADRVEMPAPNTLHLGAQPPPMLEADDIPLIYTNEK